MSVGTEIAPLVDADKPARRAYRLKDVELRDAEDGGLRFDGEAAVFSAPSDDLGGFTEVIDRGAFRKVLNTDPDVRLLINHDPNLLLARTISGTLQLREGGAGLEAHADLAPTTYAKDLRVLVKRGDMSQMSFGFRVGEDTWEEKDDGTILRTIHSFRDLFDVSVVTFPAYPQTNVSMRSINGIQIVRHDGTVAEAELRSLAWRAHRGEITLTVEQRAVIDDAFAKIGKISPWMADLARRQLDSDEDLRDLLNGASEHPRYRLAARQRRLRLLEKRQATTEVDAVEDEQGSLNLGQANVALESIQAVIEDMEETLEAAGFPDPDDPPSTDDEADDPEQPITADEALKALQAGVEQIEDILETAGFPDPDDD